MSKVKFISYDGKYPNLCRGKLIVEIEGKRVEFESYGDEVEGTYPAFWETGGYITTNRKWHMTAHEAPWELNNVYNFNEDNKYPDFIMDNLNELIKVFNENVEYGCCGGCI